MIGCGGRDRAPAAAPSQRAARNPVDRPEAPPPGWTVHWIEEPPLRIALPPGWKMMSLAATRDALAARMSATKGDVSKGSRLMIDLIDSGKLRFVGVGRLSSRWTILVSILIESGDPDLDAAVARVAALLAYIPRTDLEQQRMALPIGPSVKVTSLVHPTGGVPSQSIHYVTLLGDGTTVCLGAASPQHDTELPELMATMARSLSQEQPPAMAR
jgi:hypothetical protein